MRKLLGIVIIALCSTLPLLPGPGLGSAWAQAAAEESEPSGLVRIQSPRPGSQVWIDNELIGEAPITRYLPVGKHTVRVAADGFDPDVRRIDVMEGRTVEVTPQLIPGNGTVEFQASPGTARLIINDRDVLPVPMRFDDLAEGEYRYRFEAEGYEPEEGSFVFQRGQNLLLTARLKSSRGLVEFVTRPEGARVWLDGEHVGVTPLQVEAVDPGLHAVKIHLKGYATVFEQLDTSSGEKGSVDMKLREEGATFVVSTGRDDATVHLDGVAVGTGSTVKVPSLNRGRYLLEVSAKDHDPVDAKITVPEKGRSAWKATLKPASGKAESAIKEVVPLHENWLFWTGVGTGAAAVTAGGLITYSALKPDPIEPGDVVVRVP